VAVWVFGCLGVSERVIQGENATGQHNGQTETERQ
jgi:hypothetical protein